LLKQPQYVPMDVVDQVISIFAGTKGYADDVPKEKIPQFEKDLLDYMSATGKAIRDELAETKALSDELSEKLEGAIRDFKAAWSA